MTAAPSAPSIARSSTIQFAPSSPPHDLHPAGCRRACCNPPGPADATPTVDQVARGSLCALAGIATILLVDAACGSPGLRALFGW